MKRNNKKKIMATSFNDLCPSGSVTIPSQPAALELRGRGVALDLDWRFEQSILSQHYTDLRVSDCTVIHCNNCYRRYPSYSTTTSPFHI